MWIRSWGVYLGAFLSFGILIREARQSSDEMMNPFFVSFLVVGVGSM